jgi:serine/threonine protein kinase/Tfp pilus assembly protein PilF
MAPLRVDERLKDPSADIVTLRLCGCSGRAPVPVEPCEAPTRAYQKQKVRDDAVVAHRAHAYPGQQEHVHILRGLQEYDPRAADRLARAMLGMPAAGSEFLGFQLLTELGRGAFGRVFLARQEDLADRQVVVKITADVRGEDQTLARLNHPNIVPIYSAHRSDPFQIVCMPFHGSTTLRHVLRHVEMQPALPTSGKALSPALAGFSYVEAIVWLAARLADGLAHAHEQGIIHRDVKPGNILLTDEGQPMLLDFDIAADTRLATGGMIDRAAGTLPYMAPEQLAAFTGTPRPVDVRCDIYAFGIVLFELLTGRYPFSRPEDRRAPPPRLSGFNPAVTPALEAVVRRCFEPDPRARYLNARQLQEDLERQGTNRPLRYTPEPSHRERLCKLIRRRPRLATASLVAAGAVILVAALGGLAIARQRQLDQLRSEELERSQQQAQRAHALAAFHRFQDDLKTCQFILYTRMPEPDQLAKGIALGSGLLEQYGVLQDSSWQEAPYIQALPEHEQSELAAGMGELLVLLGRGRLVQEVQRNRAPDREALRQIQLMNERATECSPRTALSPALWRQRADVAVALGQPEQALALRNKARALPLRTAQDYYWLASEHISAGRLREALSLVQKATHLEPQNFWAWFVLAHCYERLGADSRAEAAYAACIALAPRFHWSYFNRALAFLRQRDYGLASADFDKVIELKPDLTDAYVNRALARQGLGQYLEADQDLTEALKRGDSATRLYFLRSRVRAQRGDKEGARRDYEEGMSRTPVDEKSWLARGFARLNRDPQAALADFEQALRLNPRSAAGLQNKAHVLAERLGQNMEALEVLNTAIELYPDSVPVRSGRAVVLARLGQRAPALRDAQEALLRDTTPATLYQVACVYALTSRQDSADQLRAFELLSSALRKGYGFDLLESDRDLDPIRGCPEFHRLVAGARALRVGRPATGITRKS